MMLRFRDRRIRQRAAGLTKQLTALPGAFDNGVSVPHLKSTFYMQERTNKKLTEAREMRKTAVALAVGALFAAPAAFGQTTVGNVQIYGRLYPQFVVGSSSGATAAGTSSSTLGRAPTGLNHGSRNSVDHNSSRLGFRGREDLGGGLRAIWQIESQINLTDGAPGSFASRTSFVGLEGGFGTVKLGNMDTVYKDIGDPLGILGIGSGNFVSLSNVVSSRMTFGTSGAGSFHLRAANSMTYAAPKLGGLRLYAQYATGGTSGGASDETRPAGGMTNRPKLWSLGGTYETGPFTLALAHEIHDDFFAGSNGAPAAVANPITGLTGVNSKDKGTRGTVTYVYAPGGTLQANYAKVDFTESGGAAGRFKDYTNNRWSVTWQHRWGAWRTSVGYANASAGSCSLQGGVNCTTRGLGANMWVLGTDYTFSKRTGLFLLYAKLNNNSASEQRNAENWRPEPGADSTQYAVGIRHSF